MAANYALLRALTDGLGVGLVLAKLLTEVTLFVASYQLQQRVVFPKRAPTIDADEPGLPDTTESLDSPAPQLV